MGTSGSYFVYPNNDSTHFLLNLFFASSWGIEQGYSFNGPIWSVSVEVLLYAIFFACCRLLPIRAIVLALISIAGFVVIPHYYEPIGRGIGSFFLGGCVFLAYQTIVTSNRANKITKCVTYLMVGAWVVTIVYLFYPIDKTLLSFHPSIPFLWRFDISFNLFIQKMFSVWPVIVLFPLTILALALTETHKGTFGKRVSFIGDISYSSYLLHFPLQLVFYAVVTRFAINDSVYYAPWFMVLFFSVLIVISFASYKYFEMPAQRYLRQTRDR